MPKPETYITIDAAKTLIEIAPLLEKCPALRAIRGEYRTLAAKKGCCGQNPAASYRLSIKVATVLHGQGREIQDMVLKILDADTVFGYAQTGKAIKRVIVASK